MSVTVVGIFNRVDYAEKAAREIKERGSERMIFQ